jgi:hypothetical protein
MLARGFVSMEWQNTLHEVLEQGSAQELLISLQRGIDYLKCNWYPGPHVQEPDCQVCVLLALSCALESECLKDRIWVQKVTIVRHLMNHRLPADMTKVTLGHVREMVAICARL